ncbi:Tail/DNA circulation protein [Escherichia coli]|nr:Tail/DNA circulation protein [Escherichia coli]
MWGIPLFVFHDNAVLFEVSLWIYPHFPPDLHYFRRLQAGVTDFRTRHFAACAFKVEEESAGTGRRVETHEYPNRDKPYTEDLGKITFRPSITAYVVGDDCFDQRESPD